MGFCFRIPVRDIEPKSKFEAKCFKCGKIGHRAPECQQRGKLLMGFCFRIPVRDIEPKSKFEAKCFKCGKIGHRAPECRVRFFNEKVGKSGRSVEVTCYKCGV